MFSGIRTKFLAAAIAIVASSQLRAQSEVDGILAAAMAIYQSASAKEESERRTEYESVRRLLDLVLEQHPGSDAALGIMLEDVVAGIDVSELDRLLAESEQPAVPVLTEGQPELDDERDQQEAAVEVEAIEAKAVPQRAEKEIVMDVQAELNRIGCPAGTADGVVGRKTRTAFANFIADSGTEISEEMLATEEAVIALKAQTGTVCNVRTMASTPASALGGSWGFRSECPGFGNRIIKNTGSMNLTYRGNNTLRGPSRNRQGNKGSAVIQFQGARTAATVIQFGFVTLKGNLTRSTSNMTISGTGANRCKIVAWKN